MNIIYLGFNSFKHHKRGVENVIDFQSKIWESGFTYYLHWGNTTGVYKNRNFICISIKKCFYWPLLLNLVLFKIKKKSKAILHSHNALFSIVSAYKTNILTVHDGLYYNNKNNGSKYSWLFYVLELLLYFRSSKVHFISKFTKEQTLFGKRKNYVIIPNTSHFEAYVSGHKIDSLLRNSYTILIVRSLEERARFDLLIQVATKLKGTKYSFIVAGKGPLLDHYKKIVVNEGLNNVQILGYVEDTALLKLYERCNLILNIAEHSEGFGLPIIEGYLFNKPVIASNKCAIPEIIIDPRHLFENDCESIIEKINYIELSEPFEYRKYYDSRFSNLKIARQIREMLLYI